jgi:hypothetical protein
MAPVFTATPRLVQQVRYDIGWQSKAVLTTTNYGSAPPPEELLLLYGNNL